jgi:hypothetical protein
LLQQYRGGIDHDGMYRKTGKIMLGPSELEGTLTIVREPPALLYSSILDRPELGEEAMTG